MKLAVFDFDGTITNKDTFVDFLLFTSGPIKFYFKMLLLSPLLIAYFLGFLKLEKIKTIMFKTFFRNISAETLSQLGENYADKRLPCLIRDNAMKRINWHKSQNHRVIIASASLDVYLSRWCKKTQLDFVATNLEIKNNVITGNFLRHCYGEQKLSMIKKLLLNETCEYIYAYGNSSGDKELLQWANEKYYKYF